jgi:hypothetical protein
MRDTELFFVIVHGFLNSEFKNRERLRNIAKIYKNRKPDNSRQIQLLDSLDDQYYHYRKRRSL